MSNLGTLKKLGHSERPQVTWALKVLGSYSHWDTQAFEVHTPALRHLGTLSTWCALFSKLLKANASYYTTLLRVGPIRKHICLHWTLCHKGKWEEWEMIIDFAARLLHLPLIYLVTNNMSLEGSKDLTLC